ncbi:hypothetical protein [Streptomyces sp. NPDC054866]
MTDLIHRLITWTRHLLAPGPAYAATTPQPQPLAPELATPPTPPTPRSRYGLDALLPLPGEAIRLVRPYLTAHEQLSRRRELLLATFGVDAPGPYWIHGMEVA